MGYNTWAEMTNAHDDDEALRLFRWCFRLQGIALILLICGEIALALLPDTYKATAALLLAISAALNFYAAPKIAEAAAYGYPRHHRDMALKRWRYFLIALACCALTGVHNLASLALPLQIDFLNLFMACVFYGLPLYLFLAGPGPAYDEDISRALRARALRIGYTVALLTIAVTAASAMLWPAALMPVIAWGLYASIATPIITYAFLDWRSDGETP